MTSVKIICIHTPVNDKVINLDFYAPYDTFSDEKNYQDKNITIQENDAWS